MIYCFGRYRNGKLMAQGAKVTTAKNIKEAEKIAKSLFPGKEDRNSTYVLTEKRRGEK